MTHTVLEPNALLEWVIADPVFCRHLPTGDAADAALKSRDEHRTDQVWVREQKAVRELMERALSVATSGRIAEAVAEAAFRRAFVASGQHHELAAQVSDDLRLLAEASLADYRSPTLQLLWQAYRQGTFPTVLG